MGLGLAFLVNVRVGSETEGKNFGRKKKKKKVQLGRLPHFDLFLY